MPVSTASKGRSSKIEFIRRKISVDLLLIKGISLRLNESLACRVPNDEVTVPAGFITDLASVPRFFWRIIPPWDGQYAEAAIVHDYLWRRKEYTRANRFFKIIMQRYGVPAWKRYAMHTAVVVNGWKEKVCRH